eukprot:5996179-Pyramimonas_sp.AAC.1
MTARHWGSDRGGGSPATSAPWYATRKNLGSSTRMTGSRDPPTWDNRGTGWTGPPPCSSVDGSPPQSPRSTSYSRLHATWSGPPWASPLTSSPFARPTRRTRCRPTACATHQ